MMAFRFARIGMILPMMFMHTPVAAQQLAQGKGIDLSIWRVVISLLFCIALAVGTIIVLRRKFPGNTIFKRLGTNRLTLVDQLSLGSQRSVYLIELDGKEYIALFSQQGASLIPTLDPTSVTCEAP